MSEVDIEEAAKRADKIATNRVNDMFPDNEECKKGRESEYWRIYHAEFIRMTKP